MFELADSQTRDLASNHGSLRAQATRPVTAMTDEDRKNGLASPNKETDMTFPLKTLIAATALGTTIAVPAVAETTIRLSTYVNESDIRYDGFVHFAKLVEEKTGGSVKVQIFPSATLHGWSEGVDAVQGGVSDMSWIPPISVCPVTG
jgi:hypothetical protein